MSNILTQETFGLDDTVQINDSDDDDSNDPDWIKTPLQKLSRKKVSIKFNHHRIGSTDIEGILQRSNSQNSAENETTVDLTSKPAAAKRSKSLKNGCGCKTGCLMSKCGCRRNAFSCGDSCGCVPLGNCSNSIGRDSAGSLKRERSIDEENTNNNEENKENLDEVVPCTPPKKLR